MARIELTHVTKRWGGFYAVDDLDLLIEDNAFVTLLGPSGCGKTTTLRMIAGLETVRIVHGKGTGALRKGIHEYLKNHRSVRSFAYADMDEGGLGATVVKLK